MKKKPDSKSGRSPAYSITLSALIRSDCGTVRLRLIPSAFFVWSKELAAAFQSMIGLYCDPAITPENGIHIIHVPIPSAMNRIKK